MVAAVRVLRPVPQAEAVAANPREVDRHRPRLVLGEPAFKSRRKIMEWFSRKTSVAGVQVPNWMVVLGAIIVILIIYSFIH